MVHGLISGGEEKWSGCSSIEDLSAARVYVSASNAIYRELQ